MENDVLKWKPTFCYRIRPIEAANYSFEYYALNIVEFDNRQN